MREIVFLRKNADRWQHYEALLKLDAADPDKLADIFLQLTDDLSYARTFYPKSKVVLYLNGLAADTHNRIYRNKKEKRSRLRKFFWEEVPMSAWELRWQILLSFVVFLLAGLIGALSQEHDPGFVRLILGNGYVNMTEENIRNGDPLGVYKSGSEFGSFVLIAMNNLRVMLFTFAMGILLSFGAGYILFYNGMMVGVFQYFFVKKGLFLTSFLTIWIHGAIEISCIILSGAAGFALGNSILFPGTYTRTQSLRMGAKKGLKLMLGLCPLVVIAAFLEGYVTRHSEMPWFLSLGIILSSFVFIIYYFFIHPLRLLRAARQSEYAV